MNELPKRKHPRLKEYDYSSIGAYFITFCVKNRQHRLGEIVGRFGLGAPHMEYSEYGKVVCKYIDSIEMHYENVAIDKYFIMPNHVHIIIMIKNEGVVTKSSRPTKASVPTVIAALKKLTNREFGFNMWQDSYYGRIIRNEEEYLETWKYIDENPVRWLEDEYY